VEMSAFVKNEHLRPEKIALVQDDRLRRRSFCRHIMTQNPKTLTLPRPPTAFHLKAQGREPCERTLVHG
jgi:hypothetical protein